jgi:hypothetical protein
MSSRDRKISILLLKRMDLLGSTIFKVMGQIKVNSTNNIL